MAEMSFALLDQLTVQVLHAAVGPGVGLTISLPPIFLATNPPTEYLYPGAQVVVGYQGANAEVVTVIQVINSSQFTGNLVNAHLAGETVFGATFSCQQPTDPVFTQSEIIGYIAQAQNEFLAKVPLIFEFFENNLILLGQTFQTAPGTSIEMERVAVQSNPPWTMFNIASISRTSDTVTAVLSSPSTADYWTAELGVQVYAVTDNSFNSASNGLFTLATVSPDGLTLTWPQVAASASSTGGYVSRPILTRLYESAQEQIAMQNPWWFSQSGSPKSWFQDRSGIYGWGVAPVPDLGYYAELLCSTRAGEALNLLSYFNVPDIFVPYIKYKALEFAWTKDGVQRGPSMARYAKGRFDFGVMLADRFLRNVVEKSGQLGTQMGGMF